MQSGIAPHGVFVGTAFLKWEEMEAFRVVNDEISTVKVLVYANHKRYVLRCDKQDRMQIEAYFSENGIKATEDEDETFN
jgi:hypothetical protein